jgi:hypothetical protein
MTAFPHSPRARRGAIVALDPFSPLASVILFQYNPAALSRSLQPTMGSEGGDRSEALRLKGAPVETISLEAEIDATDQLAQAEDNAVRLGIYPQLSALEMLVYPKSSLVAANAALLATGTIEIVPPQAPLTLFVWGPRRVLPVRLTGLSISEEAHDVHLNPIRARVNLDMRVLSYNDLPATHPGYYLFMSHQVVKETLASLASVNNLAGLSGVNLPAGRGG